MSIVEIKIPSPGESITEVEIGSWLKSDGDYVNIDETICEIETDKATLPLIANSTGVLKIVLQAGEIAEVGDVACYIDTDAPQPESAEVEKYAESSETAKVPEKSVSNTDSYAAGHHSPAARKMVTEQGFTGISGGGPGGRITKQDVLLHSQQFPEPAASNAEPKQEAAPPVVSGSRNIKRERLSRLRRKLAERLVAVKNETAMLTTFNEVDMHAIFELRSQSKDTFLEKYKVKLGYMGLFTKACTEALKDFPAVNAQLDGGEIVFHDYVDMGIAVSAPKGLMVPVIRNAESLTLAQIEMEIGRLAKRARKNKLSIDEMAGGTFSITNGGVFGSMLSTPILNPPQSAILGMHNIVERPMAVNGKVEIRPVMYLALSYDHRIVDGQQSVSFLVRVREYLENPTRMLLEVKVSKFQSFKVSEFQSFRVSKDLDKTITEEKHKIHTFRDLLIWQKSIKLATRIYEVTRSFPKEEAFGLTSQMRRCSVSIPSNIAEGHGRNSTGGYLRFLQIATGSLCELQTQLVIANNLSFF